MSQNFAEFEPYSCAGQIWNYLVQRFGFGEHVFSQYRLWHRPGNPRIWIAHHNCSVWKDINIQTIGMLLLRKPLPRGFPTTAFIQRFGHLATKNIYDLDIDTAINLMQGQSLPVTAKTTGSGPFIVRTPLAVVGRGWLKNGCLILDYLKEWPKSMSIGREK